jgi:hypothetical protein
MSNVNPPTALKIPAKLLADKELRVYFEQRDFIQYQLWLRTGGGNDAIEDTENGELYEPGIQTSNADELIEELENEGVTPSIVQPVEVISVLADFTTTGEQILICANSIDVDVTLNPYPDDGEQLHIKRAGDGLVTVLGDVDGNASTTIIFKYDSPHLVYTIDAGEWSII